MRLSIIFATVAALAAAPDQAVAQTYTLRLQPEPGLSSRYTVNSSFWVVSAMMPASDPDTPLIKQESYVTQTVVDATGDVASIRTVIDSSDFSLAPGLGIPNPDPTGVVVNVSMDSRGRVVAADVDPGTMPPTLRGFQAQLEQLLSGISAPLPERDVSVGDSWDSSSDATVTGPAGPMRSRNAGTYTLTAVDRDGGALVATISLEGTISQSSEPGEGAPALVSVEMAGTVTGRIQIDLMAGRIMNFENSVSLEGTVKPGNATTGAPILITANTAMRLLGD